MSGYLLKSQYSLEVITRESIVRAPISSALSAIFHTSAIRPGVMSLSGRLVFMSGFLRRRLGRMQHFVLVQFMLGYVHRPIVLGLRYVKAMLRGC